MADDPTDVPFPARRGLPRILPVVLIAGAITFLVLAITMPTMSPDKTSRTTLPWFWTFAVLPGIVGVANYIVILRQREAKPSTPQCAITAKRTGAGEDEESLHRPSFSEALAAAVLLTGVFSIVARASASTDQKLDGLVFAGYGAYISTLWFMLVRLNANALSPRFLLNSALKASIAMLIGYMAAASDVLRPVGTVMSLPALYFIIGLFHSWAMKALKKTAMATFGVAQTGAADLPVLLLEGVDDGAVDVLEELGITCVQHLATMQAPEVCGRSQYPRDRVLDWIDQAILTMHTNGRINDLRAIGIRSAYALITVAHHSRKDCHGDWDQSLREGADARFQEAAQRLGLSPGGLYLLTECIRTDPAYRLLEEAYPNRHKHADAPGPDRPPAPEPTVFPDARTASILVKSP
jgi:hypothetical protein